MCAYMDVHMLVFTCVHVHAGVYAHVCGYMWICVCWCVCVCTYVLVYVHLPVYVNVYVCWCMCVVGMHVCAYLYGIERMTSCIGS